MKSNFAIGLCGIMAVENLRSVQALKEKSILKSEMYYLKKFTSRESLVSAIENYIILADTRSV